MEPLTHEELAKALSLVAESDAFRNNTMLASMLLIASSRIEELAILKMDFDATYSELKATRNRNDEVEELLQEIKSVILRGRLTLGEKLMDRIKATCNGYS